MPTIAAGATNKNVTIAPHGTGKVVVGTGAADATIQSDGDHNLILQTGNSTTSKIEINDGANGDVAVTPNGTGNLTIDNIAISDNAITSTDTNGNIAITPNGTGEVDISKVDIDGGAVDGITLGTSSAVTEAQIDNLNIDGNAITSTNTNGNIDLTPDGTGEVNISKVDIDGGTVDGTDVTVGSGKTLDVSAGSLTTATAQKQAIVDGADVEGTVILSTGEGGGSKVLQENGSGGASWQTPSSLPSQGGNAGKILTTDATDASWTFTLDDDTVFPSGIIENCVVHRDNTRTAISVASVGTFWTVTYDKKKAGSILFVFASIFGLGQNSGKCGIGFKYGLTGAYSANIWSGGFTKSTSSEHANLITIQGKLSGWTTTGVQDLVLQYGGGTGTTSPCSLINPTAFNDGASELPTNTDSCVFIYEVS